MPYQYNRDLPDSIKNRLPEHAQDIYREVFNHAWDQYKNPEKRLRGGTQEDIAHRVAWAAVKKKYQKADDRWVLKK